MLAANLSLNDTTDMRSLNDREIFDPFAREQSITWLRETLDLNPTPIERDPSLLSPLTTGIEIEQTWRQALPVLGEEWSNREGSPRNILNSDAWDVFTKAYNEEDARVRSVLESITPAIPSPSFDAYWEFSLYPSKDLNYTKMETDSLFEAGLLRDGFEYPLHMTVAGLSTERDAFAYASALEMSGATTPSRLARAAIAKSGAWAQKSTGGIRKRRADELSGADTTGYEIRTLCITSQEQLTRTLGNAAHIATMYHSGDWGEFVKDIEGRQKAAGLALAPWPRPKADNTPWATYASLITTNAAG